MDDQRPILKEKQHVENVAVFFVGNLQSEEM